MITCQVTFEGAPLLKKIHSAPHAVREHFEKVAGNAFVVVHNTTLQGILDVAFERIYEKKGVDTAVMVTVERYDPEESVLKKSKSFQVKNLKQFEQSTSLYNAIAELQQKELVRVRTVAGNMVYDFIGLPLSGSFNPVTSFVLAQLESVKSFCTDPGCLIVTKPESAEESSLSLSPILVEIIMQLFAARYEAFKSDSHSLAIQKYLFSSRKQSRKELSLLQEQVCVLLRLIHLLSEENLDVIQGYEKMIQNLEDNLKSIQEKNEADDSQMNKILVELKRREGDLNNMQKENSELQSTNLTLEEKLSETISKYDELKKKKSMNKKLEEQMQELRSENDLLKQKVQDLERESKEQYLLLEEKENAISKMKSSKQKSKELIQTSIGKVNELEKAIQKKKPSLKKRIEDDIDSESDKESESIELHPISSKKKASTTNSSFSKRPSSPVLKDKKRKGSGIDQLSKNSELVSKTMKTFSEFMGSMKIPKLK